MYLLLKDIHIACAILSISGFTARGVWMLTGSAFLQQRLVKILPHVIDTLFLLSGIALAVLLQQYPFVHAWLTAKILGLIGYIVLGSVALKRGRTRAVRTVAFILALVTFAYVVSVAHLHHPAGFWSAF